MNWDAIGSVGEIIGAVAIIISPIYVSRQMKQSNALMREQSSYNMLKNQLSYYDGTARKAESENVVYNIPKDDSQTTIQRMAESHAAAELFRWQWEYPSAQA